LDCLVWLPPQPIGFGLSLVSLMLMLGGIGFRHFHALAHLGRSFSLMAEAAPFGTGGTLRQHSPSALCGRGRVSAGLMLQYISPLALALVRYKSASQLIRIKKTKKMCWRACFPIRSLQSPYRAAGPRSIESRHSCFVYAPTVSL